MFNTLAEVGWIKNRERFKKLETRRGWTLWEFKSFQIRFIGAFAPGIPRTFLIALGLKKKRDRHRVRDLDRAVKILEEHSIGIHVM